MNTPRTDSQLDNEDGDELSLRHEPLKLAKQKLAHKLFRKRALVPYLAKRQLGQRVQLLRRRCGGGVCLTRGVLH